jgi:hypothetical protein
MEALSVRVMTAIWELDLPAEQQQILLAMADHAHDDGTHCYPGIAYLAWKTGRSERTIQRTLRALQATGLVYVVGYEKGGRGHATEYAIDPTKGVRKSPFINERVTPTSPFTPDKAEERVTPVAIKGDTGDVKGDIHDLKGDTGDVKGDTAMSPQPSEPLEPSNEPLGEPGYGALHAPPTPPPKNARSPVVLVDGPFRARMIAEFGIALGGAQVVLDTIELALCHTNARKYGNQQLYVQNWLRGDAAKRGWNGHGNGSHGNSERRPATGGTPGRDSDGRSTGGGRTNGTAIVPATANPFTKYV